MIETSAVIDCRGYNRLVRSNGTVRSIQADPQPLQQVIRLKAAEVATEEVAKEAAEEAASVWLN